MRFLTDYKKLYRESEVRAAGLFCRLAALIVENSKLKNEISELEAIVRELCRENS